MGSYRYLEHDADLGIEVTGSLAEIWDLGARALMGAMTDPEAIRSSLRVPVRVEAPDLVSAWVETLAELLYRFDVDGQLLVAIEPPVFTESSGRVVVAATACGEIYDPARHPSEGGIKAVTHHGVLLEQQSADRWFGRVLLDL